MSKHPLPHQKVIVPQCLSREDSRVPSGKESIPELIDLREEEVPPPSPPKRAHHPTTVGLDKKMTAAAEGPPIPPAPISKGKTEMKMAPVATPKMRIVNATTSRYHTYCTEAPQCHNNPPKELEKRRLPPGTIEKKTLHEKRRGKFMMLNIPTVAKMCTRQAELHRAQELAKLACTVVPLQKLNIREDNHAQVLKHLTRA